MDDWRLMGQERYLKGVTLYKRKYKKYSEKWDHEHCQFCSETISEFDSFGYTYGYSTLDEKYWVCEKCQHDFKDMFHWKIIDLMKSEETQK